MRNLKKYPKSYQVEVASKGENGGVYFQKVRAGILKSFEDLKWEESSLTLSYIDYGEVTFSRTNNSGRAGHFVPLPKYLRMKNAIINIQNKDAFCFKCRNEGLESGGGQQCSCNTFPKRKGRTS